MELRTSCEGSDILKLQDKHHAASLHTGMSHTCPCSREKIPGLMESKFIASPPPIKSNLHATSRS